MKTDWTLLAKVFTGEADSREMQEYRDWSGADRENKKMSDMLSKNWDAIEQEGPEDKIRFDENKAWANLKGRLEKDGFTAASPRTRVRILVPGMRIAATAALLLAFSVTAYLVFRPGQDPMQMSAASEEMQELGILLPDGSVVDLNAYSRLQYSRDESGNRLVKLHGEAFFEVASDPEHPFKIETGDAMIQVTGTSFGVRNDPGSKKIEVYVESGNVNVYRSRKPDRVLRLKTGQTGVLEDDRLEMQNGPDPNRLAWKTRRLSFRETRLGDVAGVLNRTYNRQIRFENESLEDCLFTGTFDQQPIDSVVRVIQVAFDLDLNRQGKAYVLSGEGCN